MIFKFLLVLLSSSLIASQIVVHEDGSLFYNTTGAGNKWRKFYCNRCSQVAQFGTQVWCSFQDFSYHQPAFGQPFHQMSGSRISRIQVACDGTAFGIFSNQLYQYDYGFKTWDPLCFAPVRDFAPIQVDNLYAIDAETGNVIWSDGFWRWRTLNALPFVEFKRVSASCSGMLYGLMSDGTLLRRDSSWNESVPWQVMHPYYKFNDISLGRDDYSLLGILYVVDFWPVKNVPVSTAIQIAAKR